MKEIRGLTRRATAACIIGLAASLAGGAAVAAENWRAYTYNAVATVTSVKGLNTMIEAIQKETQGQLMIRLNLGGTLPIAATNITQAVSDNVVQMGDDAFFVGSVPVGGVVRLPMFLPKRADFEKAWDVEAPYLRAEYAKKNIVLLGRYIFPENVMWSSKKLASAVGYRRPEDPRDLARTGRVHQVAGRHPRSRWAPRKWRRALTAA